MKLGIRIPYQGNTRGEDVIRVARAADEAGIDAGFVGDHTVWPVTPTRTLNPSTATGKYPKPPDNPGLGAWTTLSFAAAVTSRLRLGTGVTILPHRNPVLFAKEIASLDVLSGGRVICGLGLGWMVEEFEALGVPFKTRKQRLEEGIEVLRTLWRDREGSFHGTQFSFGPVYCEPKPIQDPVPIWLGGHSEPAIDRAVRMADGWYGSFLSPEQVQPMVARMRERRSDSPRARFPFTVAVSRTVACPDDPADFNLVGAFLKFEDIGDAMKQYEDIGVDMLILDTLAQRPADLLRIIDAAIAARNAI